MKRTTLYLFCYNDVPFSFIEHFGTSQFSYYPKYITGPHDSGSIKRLELLCKVYCMYYVNLYVSTQITKRERKV